MEAKNDVYAPWVEKYGLAFPYGECQCGCGQLTNISRVSDKYGGYKRNHPKPFVLGHRPPKYQPDEMALWVKMFGLKYEYGKCQCGCGNNTTIAEYTNKPYGIIKGKPLRFLRTHINVDRHHYKYKTLMEAFEMQVAMSSIDRCWLADKIANNGYGVVYFHGKPRAAHRTAYELFVGPIPKGMYICHTCDHPQCANPDHLFLGTPQDNVNDMMAKGRRAYGNPLRGERHPNYKHGKYVDQPRAPRRYGRKR
jgi:hypothetical protein